MGRLKFAIVKNVLLIAAFCAACDGLCRAAVEPNIDLPEPQKSKVLREVAQDWLQVGISQYKRGLYEQAEESFLAARGYQEYLTAEEHKQLEEHLKSTHQAAVEKQAVLDQIKTANDLLNQGQPIKARAYYEKVRNSPYITEQQRRQIDREIQKVDLNFDRQMKEITELYNRSVELYRAGQLEKAREGFADVARYGLLVAPEGRSAEDYLIQIDSILTDRLKRPLPAKPVPLPPSSITVTPDERQQNNKQQAQDAKGRAAEVAAVAEPTPTQAELAFEAKKKIIRTYTKAVVEDTIARVQRHIIRREYDKAIDAVRKTTDIVRENRSFIGDEVFSQYSVLLKQLVDRTREARKSP